MILIQAGEPDKNVRDLDAAGREVLRRFKFGGPRTARVEDTKNLKYFVIEVTTSSRQAKVSNGHRWRNP
jgi:hypothetical protein